MKIFNLSPLIFSLVSILKSFFSHFFRYESAQYSQPSPFHLHTTYNLRPSTLFILFRILWYPYPLYLWPQHSHQLQLTIGLSLPGIKALTSPPPHWLHFVSRLWTSLCYHLGLSTLLPLNHKVCNTFATQPLLSAQPLASAHPFTCMTEYPSTPGRHNLQRSPCSSGLIRF